MVSEDDVRRLFLQAIISRGVLSAKLAQALWAKSIDAVRAASDGNLAIAHSDDPAAWNRFVDQVNTSIDSLDLEFRHLIDESTGRELYTLVNRNGDEIAQMATQYSPLEIAFFKAVVEQIMLGPHESYSVSSFAALREVNTLKSNMTKEKAEIVLNSFVSNGWLLKSKRARYLLSTRTLLELGPYLRSTYPDEIIECTICMEIVTRGMACFTANCKTRMHMHCFAIHRRHHATCPQCAQQWPQQVVAPLLPVGEGAAKDGVADERRRLRKKSPDAEDSDVGSEPEEEDERMDEDEPSQPSQPPTKSKTQASQRTQARKSSRVKAEKGKGKK